MRVASSQGFAFLALVVLVCCVALVSTPEQAHALFASSAQVRAAHGVEPFPVKLTAQPSGAEIRSSHIDRDELAVTVRYSDGSTRELANDEYDLRTDDIPAGFRGTFGNEATYREAGRDLSGAFTLAVDAAYGTQYEDALVFGRGLPAASYGDKGLTNTTWGIEDADCAPAWNKGVIVSVGDIDTVSPVSLSGWFSDSDTIRTIELDQMDASRLTSLASAFKGCHAVESIDLTGWDTCGVTSMARCFMQCYGLTEVIGLSELDTSQSTSFERLFEGDSSLKSADVARWNTGNVTDMNRTFGSCFSLTSLDLSDWDTSQVTDMKCMIYMYPTSRSSLRTVGDLSRWDVSQVKYMTSMFAYNDDIVTFGDLSGWKTPSLQKVDHIFQYCHSLNNVGDLSGWDVSHCTSFRNMFQGCNSLKSIGNVSTWRTSNVTDMYQTFQYDVELSVDCSKWDVKKVTNHTGFNGVGASKVIVPRW